MEPIWLFDLDNTLHDASPHIFPHLHRSMTAFLMAELGLDEAQASALRIRYWRRYGATLHGMMRHHGTDPHRFLRETHHIPDLAQKLVFDRALLPALRRLPGRKIIFSNAPLHYAEAVLDLMAIRKAFDGVFAIEHARFQPKPAISAYLALLRRHGLDPRRCIMVEDSWENLRTARRLGMGTVLVTPHSWRPAYVDVRVNSVLDLPRRMGQLMRR